MYNCYIISCIKYIQLLDTFYYISHLILYNFMSPENYSAMYYYSQK